MDGKFYSVAFFLDYPVIRMERLRKIMTFEAADFACRDKKHWLS